MKNFAHWSSLKNFSALPDSTQESLQQPYFNRDLSWLTFNLRVLSQAQSLDVPLLEQLRFIAIYSNNLDEFFMVRVSEIAKLARRQKTINFPDGYAPKTVLAQVRQTVRQQKEMQSEIFYNTAKKLAREGIFIHHDFAKSSQDNWIKPHLDAVEIIVRPLTARLPFLEGNSLFIFVLMEKEYALLRIKNRSDRLIFKKTSQQMHCALLERWICAKIKKFFPNKKIQESFAFKILRDADLHLHPDSEDSLEEQVLQALQRRKKAPVVRLEVDAPTYSEGVFFLAAALGIDSANLYRFNLPLDLAALFAICNQPGYAALKYPEVEPKIPKNLTGPVGLFDRIKKHDIILHHPYDSFDCVIHLLEQAACDPDVKEIYHTLYRTTHVSPVMENLKKAARNGKKVIVYVEIKARFDELNNVRWAFDLRASGVKVVPHIGLFKVHSKATVIRRKEGGQDQLYAHLGTGNYHPGNARQYTDLSFLTARKDIVLEAQSYFKSLFSRNKQMPEFKKLLVSPKNLYPGILSLIQDEINWQKKGKAGHIIIKINALTDISVIQALYAASSAGVKIDLIVRGSCCLRSGLAGLSENIKVTSIVDRFLEHSRIYYFRAGGKEKIYLSSADWRQRNFFRRYEVAFPIEDNLLKRYLYQVILKNALNDNVKAWQQQTDGSYLRKKPLPGQKTTQSQFLFQHLAENFYHNTVLDKR